MEATEGSSRLLVSIPEAARLLSVSQTLVRQLIANLGSQGGARKAKPRLASIKIGGATRIEYTEIQRLIQRGRR